MNCGFSDVCCERCAYASVATASAALSACWISLGVAYYDGTNTCKCVCHGCPCCAKACASHCATNFPCAPNCYACCYSCCSCCYCCESHAMASICYARCLWAISSVPVAVCCVSTAAFVYLLVPKEKLADGSPPTYFWQTNPGLPPTHFWQTAPPEAMVAGQPGASQQQLGTYQPQCHAPPPPSARSLQQQQQPVVVIAQPIEHCEY